ncbi:hypothetical protein [Paenibacillus sp. CAA11]|uniref:beta-xylosidase family glycoside hydrolase n=1 Tax=Paenibacillus sp. CAA11 TaxID=1532905 RepID=UPI001F338BC3|nr:hypothetical protein [Paenibacillus sp. CAA11]
MEKKSFTFENTEWDKEWIYLRHPHAHNYQFEPNKLTLKGTEVSLNQPESPTFIGIRQKDFNALISCDVSLTRGEAGITLYMDEHHHYDLALCKDENGYKVIERLNIGDIKTIQHAIDLGDHGQATLRIQSNSEQYNFYLHTNGKDIHLGSAQTKYLSSEVAGGFTGVVIGLYAYGQGSIAEFAKFKCDYSVEPRRKK